MFHYCICLTQPKDASKPALYYAGHDELGEPRWTGDLLRCGPFHTQARALGVMESLREWCRTHYRGPVKLEVQSMYAERHGLASERARADFERRRSASIIEAERVEAAILARRAAARAARKAANSRKTRDCIICGKPLPVERVSGRPAQAHAGKCRAEQVRRRRAEQVAYNRDYYKANRDRILSIRQEAAARKAEAERLARLGEHGEYGEQTREER